MFQIVEVTFTWMKMLFLISWVQDLFYTLVHTGDKYQMVWLFTKSTQLMKYVKLCDTMPLDGADHTTTMLNIYIDYYINQTQC